MNQNPTAPTTEFKVKRFKANDGCAGSNRKTRRAIKAMNQKVNRAIKQIQKKMRVP